jgi:hypothetical protein
MKITLPEHSKDITLYQYQKYVELLSRTDLDTYQFDQRKIQIFTGVKPDAYKLLTQKDKEEILLQIEISINTPFEFQNRFKMEEIEFGFIPNFDKITGGEYFDLCKYGTQPDTLHNLMAILFRPIVKEDSFGNYSIAEYQGTNEWAEAMKLTPMSVVNGALFFFLNLSTELTSYILKLENQEQARETAQSDILVNGDGMQPLTN